MNIIFLDIDGVLNPGIRNDLIENTISRTRLNLFIRLVKETDSNVVIISSRRCYEEDRNQLLRIMQNISDRISFLSEKILFKYRCDEIIYYLNNNKHGNFVIIDDIDNKYSSNQYINNHFVETNKAFDEEAYFKALKILNF